MITALLVAGQLIKGRLLTLGHLCGQPSPTANTTAHTPFVGADLSQWVLHQPCQPFLSDGVEVKTYMLQVRSFTLNLILAPWAILTGICRVVA